jgi:hypothetical protein
LPRDGDGDDEAAALTAAARCWLFLEWHVSPRITAPSDQRIEAVGVLELLQASGSWPRTVTTTPSFASVAPRLDGRPLLTSTVN